MAPFAALVVALAVAPPGFRVHDVREAGLRIALPAGWQVLAQRDAVYPGAREVLTRLEPSFAAPLNELGMPDSPLKLFAFDRRFRRGHPTTVLVLQATTGRPGTYNRWARRMAAGLRRLPGRVGPLRLAGVDLPAGTSLRATYVTRTHDAVVAYFVPSRTGIWLVLLRTPAGRAARDAGMLDRAARSLALRDPVGGAHVSPRPPGA